MKSLSLVLKAAVLIAFFEGIHIARHEALAGGWSSHNVLDAMRAFGWVAGLHLLAWMLLGLLLSMVLREPYTLFRAVFTVWAAVTFLSRWLQEGSGSTPWEPLLLIGLVLWLTPRSFWKRFSPSFRTGLACFALLTVSIFSFWGRVPDFSDPLAQQSWLYVTSAAVAILMAQAIFRWPRAAALALVGCVLSITLWNTFSRAGATDKPNVLWILIDTTRRDHIRPFGESAETPAIERLASEGIRFDDAVTVIPKTAQSVSSFFTGSYPFRHGVRALEDELVDLPTNVVTTFQQAGYRTAAFVDNPWISESHGFGHGFEDYFLTTELEPKYGGSLRYVSWFVLADHLTVQQIETGEPAAPEVYVARARSVTNSVSRYLHEVVRPPFFIYAHYFEPHWPYLPPASFEKKYGAPSGEASLVNHPDKAGITHGELIYDNHLPAEENEGARRLYQGEIDDTMTEVGRLLEELERAGYRDDTIVVFTADHGHSLGDHDYYFHHGDFLYESSVRIPLILRWPKKLPEGRVVEHQVRSIDVAPTLLTLARIRPAGEMDGRSLSGFWEGREDKPRAALLESDVKMMEENKRRRYYGVVGKLRGLRDGRFKLILTPEEEGPEFELYDVIADPEETHNLVLDGSYHETLTALQEQLWSLIPNDERRAIAEIRGEPGSMDGAAPVDEHERKLLESLGYVNR
jgi:arylsulfatase A-like enzyme